VNVNDPCPSAGTAIVKALVPVLVGEPMHALGVHCAISCATPLASVHVTGIPVSAVAISGSKQNEVPPSLHGPDVIVIPVAAEPAVATMMAADAATRTETSTPSNVRARCRVLTMRAHGEERHKRWC
jgi:hypothetical protein